MSEKNKVTTQQKIEKLNELVSWFDSDEFDIDLALDRYTAAERLAAEIDTDLRTLKNHITIVKEQISQDE